MFEKLVNFFEEKGWPITQVENQSILSSPYQGENGKWLFVASADEDNKIVVMFSRFPNGCPADKFEVMSEFLEKANFGMTHGAWVMDRSDGEIRYRVGTDVGTMPLTGEMLNNMLLYTNMTMDTYWAGITAVLQQGCSADEAFQQVFSG